MMNLLNKLIYPSVLVLFFAGFSLTPNNAYADMPKFIDDFSDQQLTNFSLPRQFLNDSLVGGKTSTQQEIVDGIIYIKGEILPPRGQPGWASTVLPLSHQEQVVDASMYTGIEVRVKVNLGMVTVSANSSEVTNFDYHGAPVAVPADGKFHMIHLPFKTMKRAWSPQTPLNPRTLNSISIVAVGLEPSSIDFAIDYVGFYQ